MCVYIYGCECGVVCVCLCVRGRPIKDGHLNNKEAMVDMSVVWVCVCVYVVCVVCGLMLARDLWWWRGHVLFCSVCFVMSNQPRGNSDENVKRKEATHSVILFRMINCPGRGYMWGYRWCCERRKHTNVKTTQEKMNAVLAITTRRMRDNKNKNNKQQQEATTCVSLLQRGGGRRVPSKS